METQTQIIIKENNLNASDQQAISSGFEGYEATALEWQTKAKLIVVTDVSQTEMISQARVARKFLSDQRLDIERNRKALKEQSLRKGQVIDSIAKYLTSLITPSEEHLELQEKFVKLQHEKKLAEILSDRIMQLSQYTQNADIYNLNTMTDEQFNTLLTGARIEHESMIATAKQAELDRIEAEKATILEQENIRKENEKLKAEAKIIEKKAAEEKIKRDEIEKKLKAAHEAELVKEREAKQQLEAELANKKAIEDKIQADAAASLKAFKTAPDKDKLIRLANSFLELEYPEMDTEEGKQIIINVKALATKVNVFIFQKINNL